MPEISTAESPTDERDPRAVDDAAEHVAAERVRAQPEGDPARVDVAGRLQALDEADAEGIVRRDPRRGDRGGKDHEQENDRARERRLAAEKAREELALARLTDVAARTRYAAGCAARC